MLADEELREELNRITDHATDQIFQQAFPAAQAIVFPVSRLVVDPERFSEDSQEPMSRVGMGVTYTRGSLRQPLRYQPTQGSLHSHHDRITANSNH